MKSLWTSIYRILYKFMLNAQKIISKNAWLQNPFRTFLTSKKKTLTTPI